MSEQLVTTAPALLPSLHALVEKMGIAVKHCKHFDGNISASYAEQWRDELEALLSRAATTQAEPCLICGGYKTACKEAVQNICLCSPSQSIASVGAGDELRLLARNTEKLVLGVINHLHGRETEFGAVRHEIREYFGRLHGALAADIEK